METPNAIAATGAGKTTDQAEFDNGAALARQGKDLPDDASPEARKGYDSVPDKERGESGDQTSAAAPGKAAEEKSKCITSHRVAPKVNTDRPEAPALSPNDVKRLNENDDVSITIDEPGKAYLIEGKGTSVKLDFENDVTPESVLSVVIHQLENPAEGAGDQYARNAVKDLKKALEWLQNGISDRLSRFGVTEAGASPLAGGIPGGGAQRT